MATVETPSGVNGNGNGAMPKKLHGRAFYESIGSPKYIVAPMVDQSEFAWRMLSRSFLPESQRSTVLAYSPMLHSRLFAENQKYRDQHFQPTRQPFGAPDTDPSAIHTPFLDGNPSIDRPLFVQFASHEPNYLLAAAKIVAPYCDAVDLNLGCPQGIAKKGHYGAFLQEDQELIFNLINILHKNLEIPVTAKIRILDTKEATLAYAENVLSAGASILTVHGRRREQKGHVTGLADWKMIRYLRDNLPPETVIFANGNILEQGDIDKCLTATGADGVMSAEGNLSNPGIFAVPPPIGEEGREYWRGKDGKGGWRVDAVFRRYLDIMHQHVLEKEAPARKPLFLPGDDIGWMNSPIEGLELSEPQPKKRQMADDGGPPSKKHKSAGQDPAMAKKAEAVPRTTNFTGMQGHLFHLLRHFVTRHHDVRDALAKLRMGELDRYEAILEMVERKVAEGLLEYEKTDGKSVEENVAAVPEVEEDGHDDEESSARTVREVKRPWWVVQPIVRPLPKEAMAKGAIQPRKVKGGGGQDRKAATATKTSSPCAAGAPPPLEAAVERLEKTTSFEKSELVSG
ncbi:dihydrouridine synthase-like protein [Podospora didyma]|uniref:tRNA-dihydrouridine(16/17) synthase [NAD(P)(+)] n=1 Tax=Podospora didyma TaxID=330526 RepID=A0AAE0K112_9PEZI|nr:dihydrouridine synthase-like protein [Podospora didyma]